jgi:hypothetical protein
MERAGKAGGYSSRIENVPEASMIPLGHGTKPTSETQSERQENPTQSLANLLKTFQELTNSNTRQQMSGILPVYPCKER